MQSSQSSICCLVLQNKHKEKNVDKFFTFVFDTQSRSTGTVSLLFHDNSLQYHWFPHAVMPYSNNHQDY